MAVTANQINKAQGARRRQRVPLAAEKVYQGTFLYRNSSGYGTGTSGTNTFAGIVVETVDNSGGSAGDLACEVYQEGVFELPLGSAAITDLGALVYGTDNYTLTKTASTNPKIGRIVEWVSTGIVRVAIDPLWT